MECKTVLLMQLITKLITQIITSLNISKRYGLKATRTKTINNLLTKKNKNIQNNKQKIKTNI